MAEFLLCRDLFVQVASPKGVGLGKSYIAGKLKELRKNSPEHGHSSRNSHLIVLSWQPSFLNLETFCSRLKVRTDLLVLPVEKHTRNGSAGNDVTHNLKKR